MKRLETYLFLTVVLLVIFTSRQTAVAETRNVKVDILDDIVLCNSTEKLFSFLIDIGTVAKTDSFVGYDLWMKYNPKLVRIITMLPGNSYTEICKAINPNYAGYTIGYNDDSTALDGSFRAYGMVTGKTLLYGDRHLVAFKAMYIGPDSVGAKSPIEIEYIDFLDAKSFKGQALVYQNSEVKIVTGDVSKNKFSINSVDHLKLEKARKCDVNIGYKIENTKELANISFVIENPKPDLFIVALAEIQPSDDLEIINSESKIENNEQKLYVKARINHLLTNNLFTLNVDLLNEITDSVEIKITPTVDDECNCIGVVEGKSFKITNTIPQVSVDETKGSYTISGNTIYLKDTHNARELYIYDISGIMIKTYTITNEKLISLNEIYNGIYFVKAKLIDDKFEIKKIIINK